MSDRSIAKWSAKTIIDSVKSHGMLTFMTEDKSTVIAEKASAAILLLEEENINMQMIFMPCREDCDSLLMQGYLFEDYGGVMNASRIYYYIHQKYNLPRLIPGMVMTALAKEWIIKSFPMLNVKAAWALEKQEWIIPGPFEPTKFPGFNYEEI